MSIYNTVSGVKQLLDADLWDEEKLPEQIITISPTVNAWVNMQIDRGTDFTESELIGEPIIVLAANCFTVYALLSTQLDGHSVEEESLAIRRLEDAKDYIRAYCFRNGITPTFDAINETVSGCVDFAFATGTDAGCI